MIANRRTLSIFRATPLAIMLIFLSCTDTSERSTTAPGQSQPEPTATIADDTPRFRVDPFWARDLPDNWILGEVAGVAVDQRDHVWIVHRPRSLDARQRGEEGMCCVPAPPVIEFSARGLRAPFVGRPR